MQLIIARHPEDKDSADGIINGQRNPDVTRLGFLQIHQMIERMKVEGLQPNVVCSSPLLRAKLLGDQAVLNFKTPYYIMDALMERKLGVLEGKPQKDVHKFAKSVVKIKTRCFALEAEDAETYEEVYARAGLALEKIVKRGSPNQNILVATHGTLGKMMIANLSQVAWLRALYKIKPLDYCEYRVFNI